MHRFLVFGFSAFMAMSCGRGEQPGDTGWINTSHLEHLYDEIEVNGKTLGVIWIYCEAPDYRLVADEDEGFTCVDDVGRALVFYCREYAARPNEPTLRKVRSLSEFILHMQAENGYFYNFMLPNRQANVTHQNSSAVPAFWAWRAFWALSELNLLEAAELETLQARSLAGMLAIVRNLEGLCTDPVQYRLYGGVKVPACLADLGGDQAGVILLALSNYYRAHPSEEAYNLIIRFGSLLLESQHGNADAPPHFAFFSWQNYWHAWGNIQAYALLRAGRLTDHQPFIRAALNEVRYFYPYCLKQGLLNEFKARIDEQDSMTLETRHFPQIAYGVRPMVFAALEAHAAEEDPEFMNTAVELTSWFFGANPAGKAMYDPATGRTFDGIGGPDEVNHNSGAESTIEALLTLQAIESVPEARQLLRERGRRKVKSKK